MIYVFVFTGEFGYELLNWQGVIRYFTKQIDKTESKVVCCSRKGLETVYDFADLFIDISDVPLFKESVADMYRSEKENCYFDNKNNWILSKQEDLARKIFEEENIKYRLNTENQIKEYVEDKLSEYYPPDLKRDYIFSSRQEKRNNITFGVGGIYEDINLQHNIIEKIKMNKSCIDVVQKKIPFVFNEDYVLVQCAKRDIVVRSKKELRTDLLISKMEENTKIVYLNFKTGRNLDSSSQWGQEEGGFIYECSSLSEQTVLIENAKQCVFFTEGDFRSHNYIPPLMGKNVYSIADESVYNLPTTPIDFWNKNVFKFGGAIKPIVYNDELFSNDSYCSKLARDILYEE